MHAQYNNQNYNRNTNILILITETVFPIIPVVCLQVKALGK